MVTTLLSLRDRPEVKTWHLCDFTSQNASGPDPPPSDVNEPILLPPYVIADNADTDVMIVTSTQVQSLRAMLEKEWRRKRKQERERAHRERERADQEQIKVLIKDQARRVTGLERGLKRYKDKYHSLSAHVRERPSTNPLAEGQGELGGAHGTHDSNESGRPRRLPNSTHGQYMSLLFVSDVLYPSANRGMDKKFKRFLHFGCVGMKVVNLSNKVNNGPRGT
ncbi:hypothetical protein KSP39_PZI005866 [Platanthera zijinensis]|uniref:Uncharacterized protein n=1 Tax=Platanthera zijinensis TaxID=2320716 RepID=A0AAP0BS76_9ASPA